MEIKDKTDKTLDELVANGDIKSYRYAQVFPEANREILTFERLYITFASGKTLTLDTTCSGVMENTGFVIGIIQKVKKD